MDRNVTIATVVALIVVGFLLIWGWQKAVPSTPVTDVASPVAPPPAGIIDPGSAAVLAQPAAPPAPTPDATYWVMDNARLATKSLDDLVAYNQEDNRPPIGYPNGTTRDDHNVTPTQNLMQMDGRIIVVSDASPVDILSWGSDDMAQVRIREGKKTGASGWINKHLLRCNNNGTYEPAFPVEIK